MNSTAHRVDWQQLITDLQRAGLKPHVIADRAGCGRTTIIAYHQYGNTPRHETGERLIGVWCEAMGRVRSDVPKIGCNAAVVSVTMLTG